ncbi:MAG: DNA helicase RecQ [Akkermansiaceae bacterium]
MSATMTVEKTLKDVFGFSEFRPNQEKLVRGVLEGKDVFGVMPTGGGKSLCYQLPAVVLDGCCVVVSPLIALMKDQVDAARGNGIRAAFLNSTLDPMEMREVEEAYRNGKLDLLYVAPERFGAGGVNGGFVELLRSCAEGRPSFFAIDEAHCISEWGHDFRPDYMFLSRLKLIFPGVPVVAYTATATEKVAADIEKRLELEGAVKVRASFDRKNLFYEVRTKKDWERQLVDYVSERKGQSGVVYRTTRKSVEQTVDLLKRNGVNARGYHAGMDADVRAKAQEGFIRDDCDVIVATVAFGMGIDKADVRFVVHVDLPKNLEGYYQETGRAGRDGEKSSCLLLHGSGDVVKLTRFIEDIGDEVERERTRGLLRAMDRFAAVPQCRRRALLGYFNERYVEGNCGGCDFCSGEFTAVDATRDAQIVLSAVARTNGKFGAVQVCDIVVGAKTAKIKQFGHDELKTYGAGKDKPKGYWRSVIDALLTGEYLVLSKAQFPVPGMTQSGWDLMMGKGQNGGKFSMQVDQRVEPEKMGGRSGGSGSYGSDEEQVCHEGLFDYLRSLRKVEADKAEVPPYVVFADKTLRQMAAVMPESLEVMGRLHGVGAAKLEKYGEVFRAGVEHYLGENPDVRAEKVEIEGLKTVAKASTNSGGGKLKRGLSETYKTTLGMLHEGMSAQEISDKRGVGLSTVEGHVARLFEEGEALELRDYVTEAEEKLCLELIEEHGAAALKPIYEASGEKLSYGVIKIVMAVNKE